ncbi:exodeoxyribonuclease VII small subunit [Clostridium grantii]|uniref:Exodeoxyribonuclease 7 small subunit n=1 Tax=Clostridium grantii DSM 8605 TaxID=1121316 RepID=A0A1M5SES5_9CLOT|nr:exodeoxyribonuclease VII small subunit [Clostridium grantii]SHH37054.1 Exodeoxyribonuclease VII small subunit [Clostridium grantii DSM 8605]
MPKKKENYEDLFKQLETIVQDMDEDNISLDSSMKNYEKGIELTNKLYKILSEAEGKIKIIDKNQEEKLFEDDEDERI